MSDRPETGALEFEGDWRGVFIQGQEALFLAMGLRILADKLDGVELELSLNEMMMGASVDTLRHLSALLGSAYQHGEGPVQRCKAWAECEVKEGSDE